MKLIRGIIFSYLEQLKNGHISIPEIMVSTTLSNKNPFDTPYNRYEGNHQGLYMLNDNRLCLQKAKWKHADKTVMHIALILYLLP